MPHLTKNALTELSVEAFRLTDLAMRANLHLIETKWQPALYIESINRHVAPRAVGKFYTSIFLLPRQIGSRLRHHSNPM